MKIAVTSTGNDLNSEIDPRFGRASYFVMIDLDTMEFIIKDNVQNLDLPQGAGIQAAKTIVENGAEYLITGHCGPKAFHVLKQAGVKVILNVKGPVSDAVDRFKNGELKPSDSADVDGHWV